MRFHLKQMLGVFALLIAQGALGQAGVALNSTDSLNSSVAWTNSPIPDNSMAPPPATSMPVAMPGFATYGYYSNPSPTFQYMYGYGYGGRPEYHYGSYPIPVPPPAPSPAPYPTPPLPSAPSSYWYPPLSPPPASYGGYSCGFGYHNIGYYNAYSGSYGSYQTLEYSCTQGGYGYGGYGYDTLGLSAAAPASQPIASNTTGPLAYSMAGAPAGQAPANSTTPGECYCPYDSDWGTWAISDTRCRDALYRRCGTDARLPCAWLDQYFDSTTAAAVINASAAANRAHEGDIAQYLYNDCPPAPPCRCADQQPAAVPAPGPTPSRDCCTQLREYVRIPFSGLTENATLAACASYSPSATPVVRAWIQRELWHATCTVGAGTRLYRLVADPLLSPSRSAAAARSRGDDARKTAIVAGVGSVVGGLLLAVGGAVAYRRFKTTPATSYPLLP